MRYPTLILTLALLLSLSSVSPAAWQNPQETPTKPLYQPTGNEATLTGSIIGNGELPIIRRYDMSADPVCVKLNVGRYELDDLLVTDQRVVNTFVFLKSDALKAYRFEVPESEVTLAHKNCRFSPRIVGIRVGQRLSVVNNDPTAHNTHPVPTLNKEWNASQGPASTPLVKSFTHPEQFVPVKDNMHPWQRAMVGVFEHPFFAVSDEFGNYEIRGLPAGKYKLVAWHETLGEQEMEITIIPGENRKIDFTFDLAKQRLRE